MTVKILVGDVRAMLATLPSESVDLALYSPPYWGLRDYGEVGQLGMEPTIGEHIAIQVEVAEQVRRILKPHGSCFINYGDCYATTPNGRSAADTKLLGNDDRTFRDKPFSTIGGSIKAKDLCMIPNRLAIALQDAGWWVRSEIIWGKTNPMPDSSGSQRPSTSHEKIFWLAKSDDGPIWRARDTGELSFLPDLTERCPLITKPDKTGARWIRIGTYYDADAVMQGRVGDEDANGFRGGSYVNGKPGPRGVTGNRRVKMPDGWDTAAGGHGSHHRQGREKGKKIARRFLRNYEPAALPVWEMAIEPFKDAHFATFPTELARRAILAGCPIGGTVLDPFGGALTTALVADQLQRHSICIELSTAYVEMGVKRLRTDSSMFCEIEVQIGGGSSDTNGKARGPL